MAAAVLRAERAVGRAGALSIIGAGIAAGPRAGLPALAVALAAALMIAVSGCGGGAPRATIDAPYAAEIEPTVPRPRPDIPPYPNLSDVRERPLDLPTPEELAERQRQLEADRAAAGPASRGEAAPEPAPQGTPLPELDEAMAVPAPPPAPVPAGSSGLVSVDRAGVSVQVATVYFSPGDPSLDDAALAVLRQVAAERQAIGGTVRVVAFTASGADPAGWRIRTTAIGEALIRSGVPADRVIGEAGVPPADTEIDQDRAVIYLDY